MKVMDSRLAVSLAILLLVHACGGPEESTRKPEKPIDFAYTVDGEEHRLAELRGRPLVLVLVRVSEVVSEMFLYQVVDAYPRSAGKARFLVLTLEPSEAPLLGPYVEHHKLPFSIGVAEWSVANGESELGLIPLVPTTVFIDDEGRIATAFAGVAPADDLVREIERLGWR
jgi:hypothetical protein